jgi:hypothetical protein
VVVRVGGIVRPDPDPEEGLARVARDLDEEEFAEWMSDYRSGRWMLVCLELFADVLSDEGVARRCDGGVRSLYFGVPHGEDNVVHAREILAQYLDCLAGALRDDGVDVTPGELERLPVVVELGAEIETRLSA